MEEKQTNSPIAQGAVYTFNDPISTINEDREAIFDDFINRMIAQGKPPADAEELITRGIVSPCVRLYGYFKDENQTKEDKKYPLREVKKIHEEYMDNILNGEL
jgi:hypothetical protein